MSNKTPPTEEKLCPFCKKKVAKLHAHDPDYARVICALSDGGCGAQGPLGLGNVEDAVAGWDRSAAPDQGDGSREGRFECSANGHTIYDTDFTNDGSLAVTGDFASDEDRIAYARRITDKLNALPSARKDAPEQAVAWMDWNEDGVAFVSGSQKPKTRAGENWQPLYAHPPRLDAQTVERCARVCEVAAMLFTDKSQVVALEHAADAIRALRST